MLLEVTVSPHPAGPGGTTSTGASGAAASWPRTVCEQQFEAMRTGDRALLQAHVHPKATNREARDEPLDCRELGPSAILATANLLRGAFDDLAWSVHEVAVDGDLVAAHVTMSGRQIDTFHSYDRVGRVDSAFPSRGRRFAVTQTHWWRMLDGLVVEHWANRDDLGMAQQLGWIPPNPWFVARMLRALRRARRAESRHGGPVGPGLECWALLQRTGQA